MTPAAAGAATVPLEDLFLLVFVLVDDLYDHIAPDALRHRPGVHRLACSDSEILTLSLVQEALSMDSEEAFHRFVCRNYLDLFPHLVSRDRYHRRRKALLHLHQMLFTHIARQAAPRASYLVVDSAPVETVAFVRSQSGQASIPEASYGFIPSKKRHFFGLRLHALVTNEGTIADFALILLMQANARWPRICCARTGQRRCWPIAATMALISSGGQRPTGSISWCGSARVEASRPEQGSKAVGRWSKRCLRCWPTSFAWRRRVRIQRGVWPCAW